MADLTAGVTLDTDAWGAAGLAKNYTELGPAFWSAWHKIRSRNRISKSGIFK